VGASADTAPEPLPFEGEQLYELQGCSMAVLHTTPQHNQTWRPLGIAPSSPQENMMLREKTKNFKRLCDDPQVRQPRRLPVGAELLPGRGVHFRVWASQRCQVEVVLEGGPGRGLARSHGSSH
jgi:hypothetical protein